MEPGSRTQMGTRSTDHVSVEIKQEDETYLMLKIKEQMDTVSVPHCICRVPHTISKDNEKSYFPQLVSVGPLHKLTGTEDKKWRYLYALLNREPNVEARLHRCVKALKELEPKVRKFYGEEINLNSDELVKTMLVDGCFIIEVLLKYSVKGLRRRDDPFFHTKDTFFQLRSDMILLENQIPFCVLQRLFDLVPIPDQCTKSLPLLALGFFKRMIPGDLQSLEEKCSQDCSHLLDLIHNCYLPTYPEVESWVGQINLECATKMQKSGIRFKSNAPAKSLLDVKFVNGVLKIPPLNVHYYTEILFRNLIALEHCPHDQAKYVTSYVYLLAKVIQSEKDLRLLSRKGILSIGLERKQEFLDLFKKILVEMEAKDVYYEGTREQANRYTRTSWRQWCWKMKERCKRNPLAVAGFILAILFVAFTLTGSLFSVLSFSSHHF